MTTGTRPSRRRLDPDALAALEDERAFLLRSIADLDAELAAGDIDEADHAALHDDYTRRAAEVIRAIEADRDAFAAVPGFGWRSVLVWVVGLAVLGGVAGVLLARASGARTDADGITGDVRASVITRLNEARTFLGDEERWDDAIVLYDSVLDEQPSNAEALTYRAWLQYRSGEDPDAALADMAEAARLDPAYADAVVFRTIVLTDLERWDEAAEVLESIDLANAPPEIATLISQRGLDGQIYGESRFEQLQASEEPKLQELDLTVDQALAAAGHLLSSGREGGPVAALKLYGAVLLAEPTNPAALSRRALVLAQSGFPDQAAELLELAVEANPDDPEVRLSRATVLAGTGAAADVATACTDLEALAALPDVPQPIADRGTELAAALCD